MNIINFCNDFDSLKFEKKSYDVEKLASISSKEFDKSFDMIKTNLLLVDKILEHAVKIKNDEVVSFILSQSSDKEYRLRIAFENSIYYNNLSLFKRLIKENPPSCLSKDIMSHIYYTILQTNNTKFFSILFS